MAKKLRPWLEKFYQHLKTKHEGDMVTAAELMAVTKWSVATLQAHINKNALARFLTPVGSVNPTKDATFRVRLDGSSISKDDVDQAFTQIRPTSLNLSGGIRFKAVDADYELMSELGRGAVAQVWKCMRTRDKKEFALKVVDPRADLLEPSTLDNVKQRFAREAKNGKKLSHPNIITFVDTGRYHDHDFLVMGLADQSLATQIKTATLTVDEWKPVIAACAAGLKYLHDAQCVHRDVKPHNILRFGTRYVLGDLGIVQWSDMNPMFTSAGTITKAAVQLGSWYYMAPEQRAAPHDATPASDIYALGVTWYEMLTGRTLDPSYVAAKAFDDPCRDAGTNALIRRMLEFEQRKRPSADEILADLTGA